MRFEYTDHAEENVNERRLNKELIGGVINNPEKVIDSIFGREIAQRTIGNKLFSILY